MTQLSGHLKETLMRVYDMRPSTAEEVMEIAEHIDRIAKSEYARGYEEGKKQALMEIAEVMDKEAEDIIENAIPVEYVIRKDGVYIKGEEHLGKFDTLESLKDPIKRIIYANAEREKDMEIEE